MRVYYYSRLYKISHLLTDLTPYLGFANKQQVPTIYAIELKFNIENVLFFHRLCT